MHISIQHDEVHVYNRWTYFDYDDGELVEDDSKMPPVPAQDIERLHFAFGTHHWISNLL